MKKVPAATGDVSARQKPWFSTQLWCLSWVILKFVSWTEWLNLAIRFSLWGNEDADVTEVGLFHASSWCTGTVCDWWRWLYWLLSTGPRYPVWVTTVTSKSNPASRTTEPATSRWILWSFAGLYRVSRNKYNDLHVKPLRKIAAQRCWLQFEQKHLQALVGLCGFRCGFRPGGLYLMDDQERLEREFQHYYITRRSVCYL